MAKELGRRARVGLAAVVVSTAFVGLAPPASGDSQLGAGQVAPLNSAVVGVPVPADGRLDGYAFAAKVLHAGVVSKLAGQDGTISGAPGQRLAVFDVSVTEYSSLSGEANFFQFTADELPDPTFTLVAGTERVDLPVNTGLGGPFENAWAVGVPAGVPVQVIATRQGFSQAFSLDRRGLVPPVPLVMYRDPDTPVPRTDPDSTQVLSATKPDRTAIPYSLMLDRVALTYFAPDPAVPPPPADRAYLVAHLGGTADQHSDAGWTAEDPLPPGLVHLQLPDRSSVPAHYRTDPANWEGQGWYWFEVPAALTSARLVLGPGTGQVHSSYSDGEATVQLTAPASFAFTLPAPVRAPSGSSSAGHPWSHGGGGMPVWVWMLVGALVAVGLGVLLARRRRPRERLVLALDAGGPRYVQAASPSAALLRGPAGALGPVIDLDDDAVRPAPPPSTDEPPEPVAQPPDETSLSVLVLGRLEVHGLADEISSQPVLRCLLYLALNPGRAVRVDELRNVLGSAEREPGARTVHNYLRTLRRALPSGLLPTASRTSGYRLSDRVTVDWLEFGDLVAQAGRAEGARRVELLTEALGLVRGVALAHVGWSALDDLTEQIDQGIEAAALDLYQLCLDAGDQRAAERAATQGLVGNPESLRLTQAREAARRAMGTAASDLEDA